MEIPTTHNGRSGASRRERLVPSKPTNNQFRVLLARLQTLGLGTGSLKTIGITSSNRREGVSTVACNLALHAASCHDLRVLIVDANFTHPGLHRMFGVSQAPGLSDLLYENAIKSDCIHDMSTRPLKSWPAAIRRSIRRSTGTSGFGARNRKIETAPPLSVLPVGNRSLCATDFPGWSDDEFLETVCEDFDMMIVDLPAVSSAASYGFSVSQLDGVLVVLQAEKTSDMAAQKSLRLIKSNGANVLGVVLNKCRIHLPKWIDNKLGD